MNPMQEALSEWIGRTYKAPPSSRLADKPDFAYVAK
jgi:hypothetical protein